MIIEPRLAKKKSTLNIIPTDYLGVFLNYITSKTNASNRICYPNILYKGVKKPQPLLLNVTILQTKEPYENYKKDISDCFNNDKTKIILIPVKIYDQELDITHFNVVIINKNTKRIEYFEPYGTIKMKDIENFKRFIYYYFKNLINDDNEYELKFIANSCPRGLQKLQEGEEEMPKGTGLCTAWVILIMHIIILNPTYKTSYIVRYLISNYGNNLSGYIRRYITYLEELGEKQNHSYTT